VYIETDPCRFSNFLSGLTPIHSLLPNSFQLNLFADPPPPKPIRYNLLQKHRGEAYSRRSHPERMPVPSDHRESRDLTQALNPLAATLAENHLVSPIIATLPKKGVSNACVCDTSETPRGLLLRPRISQSTYSLIGRSLRTGLGVSLHAFLSTFNCRPLLFCSSTGPVHFAVQSGGRRKDGEMNERHKGQGNALTRRTLTRLECAARR